ncbi:hypothetical protein TSOC_003636 [Tetrabaena socialis]|uniref:Calcium/calmodulin-dependent protein kinase II association-domain domain-containing protein n=1 Tax=Tetrabaena socialis TaxID=47790 RepID=A0A2J8AB26_9CHLO|nr:hypothetical protein TSOC_003636 [Tetrabaena socialis]|eukprot:PNH09721.1 hypothetical protein TSOC_003636 [Tetrabaena socialis]
MARVLPFLAALLLALASHAAAGRGLLEACRPLTAAAVVAYNDAKGSVFDFACFEPAPVEKSCGGIASGLCIFEKGISCYYKAKPCKPTDTQVLALFAEWNAALATLNASKVAALYAPTAVLLPTVSNKVRNTRAEIENYFVSFLKRKPQSVIDSIAGSSPNIRFLAPDVAINSGTYVFALTNAETGVVSNIHARFTYVYKKYGDYWLIEDHHSSVMPEPV